MPFPSYDIDFQKMVQRLLGSWDNKPIRVAWLTACFKALRTIHDKFLAFTNEKLEQVKYNGQTFVLEKMLQHYFGAGITITNNIGDLDGMTIGDSPDWSSAVGDGVDYDGAVGEVFIVAQYNFTVNVPSSIIFVQSEMEAYIRRYKLFGTTFNIVVV